MNLGVPGGVLGCGGQSRWWAVSSSSLDHHWLQATVLLHTVNGHRVRNQIPGHKHLRYVIVSGYYVMCDGGVD